MIEWTPQLTRVIHHASAVGETLTLQNAGGGYEATAWKLDRTEVVHATFQGLGVPRVAVDVHWLRDQLAWQPDALTYELGCDVTASSPGIQARCAPSPLSGPESLPVLEFAACATATRDWLQRALTAVASCQDSVELRVEDGVFAVVVGSDDSRIDVGLECAEGNARCPGVRVARLQRFLADAPDCVITLHVAHSAVMLRYYDEGVLVEYILGGGGA